MKKISKKLIVTLSLLIACVAAIVGTTLALVFTTVDVGEVKVAGAFIDIEDEAVTLGKIYSSKKGTAATTDANYSGKIENCDIASLNGTYVYEEQTGGFFKNGGKVTADDTTITIDGMCPGDKVEFTVSCTISTNIIVTYEVVCNGIDETDKANPERLAHYLEFSAGETGTGTFTPTPTNGEKEVSINCSLSIPVDAHWETLPDADTNATEAGIELSFKIQVVQAL